MMVDPKDKLALCVWLGVSDAQLSAVFADCDAKCTPEQRSDAKHVIRWCLQGDPKRRPTMETLLEHRFLGGLTPPPPQTSARVRSTIDGSELKPIFELTSKRELFHVFISHSASPDLG